MTNQPYKTRLISLPEAAELSGRGNTLSPNPSPSEREGDAGRLLAPSEGEGNTGRFLAPSPSEGEGWGGGVP